MSAAAAAPPPPARPNTASEGGDTRFFGSQIGGRSAINYSYTDMPWKLMAWDVYHFFQYLWAIPYILWPVRPADSAELSELSPTWGNLFSIAVHVVLCVLQLAGIVALPLLLVLPVWTAAGLVGLFMLLNKALCMLLNGEGVEYHSDPEYAPARPEHAHEQWIYINGVAAGAHWMQSNLNRLAVTFKRPILGIHNKTSGILFDVVECLIQRNWGYATNDVRVCYRIIKKKLYNPRYSKVIFILHSQGGIEGSLILDWLLQELPQDLLSKLEVYTFGNAANHFNNPHRHISSQTLAKRHPFAASIDSNPLASAEAVCAPPLRQPQPKPRARQRSTAEPYPYPNGTSHPLAPLTTTNCNPPVNGIKTSTTTPHPSTLSDRAIGHIEHYAHTTDFVALWGVLHFATASRSSPTIPRFIGRVFARTSGGGRGGHQMVQHYLDGMFPLKRDKTTGMLLRGEGGVPLGASEENEFMESEVSIGGKENGDKEPEGESEDEGEEEQVEEAVEIHGLSPVLEKRRSLIKERRDEEGMKVKVKELSRLWQYRNGRSPEDTPPGLVRGMDGVVRNATM